MGLMASAKGMSAIIRTISRTWKPVSLAAVASISILLAANVFAAAAGTRGFAAKSEMPSNNVIKIGFIASLTGLVPDHNQELVNGFNLYLDQIGHKMAGKDVQVIIQDDEGKVSKCVEYAKRLIQRDKVSLIGGIFYAPIAYKVAPVVNDLKTPLIIASSAADDVTKRVRYDWVIRTCRAGSQVTHPLGDYAAKQLHFKRIAIVSGSQPYCYETQGGFQHAFEEAGGQIVQKLWVPFDAGDYSNSIKRIKKNVDAVFVVLSNGTNATFGKQYHALNGKVPLLSVEQTVSEFSLLNSGDAWLGTICGSAYTAALNTPENKRFEAAYRAKFGQEPGVFAANGYANAMFIHKAVDALKGDVSDKAKLMAALRKVSINSPLGSLKLDKYGQSVENIYITKVEKKNGRYQNSVVFTYHDVSQFWKWDPLRFLKEPLYSRTDPPCTHCL